MIDGRYFEPMNARAIPARLWGVAGDLRLQVEGEAVPRRPKLVSLSDRLGSVPRKFTFEDGGVFEAPADADVDGLMASHGSFFSVLSRIEANRNFMIGAAIATILLLVGIYRYGLPLAASAAAHVTPTAVVDVMDAGTLKTVDTTFFSPSTLDEGRKREIRELFDELARVSGQTDPDLELHFRDGGRLDANAFALPGGTIVITDQLIKKAKSDDEIAGVLAHEIGHVQNRHQLQQIYRLLGISFMIGVIGGDASQIVDDVVTQAAALQSLAYTREFEAHADARSVEIMVAAGRNPLAFVDLLDRITADHGGSKKTGWLSSHPGTDDRRSSVSEKAKSLGWQG
jgi:Zn-dependent protease with chaperone function